ncbi:MAG TPA: VCBS repeat-containing protein [Candidatus Limnocylindrales bacterium]|nr:VCBS repeat-containing protein [Candidatus Limnocylindrales bacterium]
MLQGAVGIAGSCGRCLCDVDSSGAVSAVDALTTLRRAVGTGAALHCPACTCTAITRLDTGARPSSVVAVDIDKDGYVDLVTADLEADEVSVFYGRGRGVFSERKAFAVGDTPQSVTIADLDDDGHLDIVTSDALPNSLTVLFGRAGRKFVRAADPIPTGVAPINSVAVDINGDDKLDLVVANSLSQDISVLLGHGDGTFAQDVRYAVGAGPRWVALADMDGDDILDAVTANRDSNDLSILYGDGDGGFGNEKLVGGVGAPYHVSLADLDGDDRTDIVVASNSADAIAVLLAKGDHNFEEPVLYAASSNTIQTDVGFVDDDDVLDVVAVNYAGADRGLSVFLGNGDGTFANARVEATGFKSRSVALADIDGDSLTDVITANSGDGADDLTLFHGKGDGSFAGPVESEATPQTNDLVVADFDHDGFDDVATTDLAQTVTVYGSDGTGHFDRTVHPVGTVPFVLFVGQITGSTQADLIATAADTNGEESAQRSVVLVGSGDGTFTVSPASTQLTNGEAIRQSTAAGDIDGDGRTDLAIGAGEIELFLGQADGTFESFDELDALTTFPALAVADLDRDGDDDVLELVREHGTLRVHRNKGDGNFAAPVSYDVAADFYLAVADIDSDGDADVVTSTDHDGGTISVLRNTGQGTFGQQIVSHAGGLVYPFVVADFDGDRAADFTSVTADGHVLLLPGDAKGHFGESHSASTVAFSSGAFAAFVDDGFFDASPGRDLVLAGRAEGRGNRLVVLSDAGECMVR